MQRMKRYDLYWVAGVLEGEGCFTINKGPATKDGSRLLRARIHLNMVDEDIVRRVHRLLGVGSVGGPYGQDRNDKWGSKAQGYYKLSIAAEGAEEIIKMLLDEGVMGERRTRRMEEVLAASGTREPAMLS